MPSPVSITLGRDCTVSVDGVSLVGVRSASVTMQRSEIEVPVFTTGETITLPGSRTLTVELETISSADAATLTAAMNDTSAGVLITGTHVSATFVVTSLAASEPLDDVVVYTATLKRTVPNAAV